MSIKEINKNKNIELSIIIPLYNEQEVFPKLIDRINKCLNSLPKYTEILLVNDGSEDNTPSLIDNICQSSNKYIGIHFSRNFGHQQAIAAGLMFARGDVVSIIDGDLQDPPELIPEMLSKIYDGYDVVYAIRKKRKESIIKRFFYSSFYKLFNFLSSLKIPLDSGDFCIMTRRVVDNINNMGESYRFNRGLRSYVGFKQTEFEYDRSAREAGKPKYTFTKLFILAVDGIFTFTEKPLRISTIFGFFIAIVSFIYVVRLILWRLFTDANLPGFATLAAGLFFFSGIQLICIGILGEYIGKINNEVKSRPVYIIDRITGLEL